LARQVYLESGIVAEVAPFFRDMAARLARAHLVIGRAGASTVTELAVAGRPSLLIPLGVALDDDQGQNAAILGAAGAAEVLREGNLTAPAMTTRLAALLQDGPRLTRMAAAAASLGRPDGAEQLADVVEAVAAPNPVIPGRGANPQVTGTHIAVRQPRGFTRSPGSLHKSPRSFAG
jgi:UDP-N-acetylglucosamine--N-acetylmuramyl-(pentapeptide) pyrophosphoryl-undecaprenol N-acetylglucosamine transferase